MPLFGFASAGASKGDMPLVQLHIGRLTDNDQFVYGPDLVEFHEGKTSGALSLIRSPCGASSIEIKTVFEEGLGSSRSRIDFDTANCVLSMWEDKHIDPLIVASVLVSPCMPLWLRTTHRYLPLHASVISMADQAIAICGQSGAGKTTLSLQCRKRSFAIIADDMAAVDLDSGFVHHGAAFSRIERQQFAQLVATGEAYRNPRLQKNLLDTSEHDYWSDPRPLPLTAVFLLCDFSNDERVFLEPISKFQAGLALNANLAGEMFPLKKTDQQAGFSAAMKLAQNTKVFKLHRPKGLEYLDEAINAILSEIA